MSDFGFQVSVFGFQLYKKRFLLLIIIFSEIQNPTSDTQIKKSEIRNPKSIIDIFFFKTTVGIQI